LQLEDYLNVLSDIPKISLEKFLSLYKKNIKEQKALLKIINFIETIAEYTQTTQKDIKFLDKYISFLEICNLFVLLSQLHIEKNKLMTEIKIAEKREKSAELNTKIILLNKLNESINDYNTELKLFEEDYLSIKNQKNLLEKTLENKNRTQTSLKKEQKNIFNQINKLTRENATLSNDQNKKIEELRTNAKILRDKIKKLKHKIENSQRKLNQIGPKFREYDKIYQNLKKNIEIDEGKIQKIRAELEDFIEIDKLDKVSLPSLKEISNIRPMSIIKPNFDDISKKILKIENINQKYFSFENDFLIKDLEQFRINLEEFFSNEMKTFDKKEIESNIKSLKQLGIRLYNFQKQINEFLVTINLKSSIEFELNLTPALTKSSKIFINFNRGKDKHVQFNNLTTPEKVFFVICFYLTIEILKNKNNILCTNLLIPKDYNKQGSIIRTLTKIIPILLENPALKDKKFTFLFSGFKLTKDIKNVIIFNTNSN